MNILKSPEYETVNYVNYQKFYLPIVWIILLFIGIDVYVEFNYSDHITGFIKDLAKILIIGFMLIANSIFNFDSRKILIVTFYLVIISVFISMPYLVILYNLPFETSYLKAELICLILTLGIGVLVRPIHMIVFIAINIVFTIISIVLTKGSYPLTSFLFYFLMSSAAGLLGYKIYMINLPLNQRISSTIAHSQCAISN